MRRLIVLLATVFAVTAATAGDGTASTVVRWISSTGGDWSVGSNWSGGAVPTATDDVLIDMPTSSPITNAAATTQINSLISNQALVISGGLQVAGTLLCDGPISVVGGNIVTGGAAIYNGAVTVTAGGTTFQATGAAGSLQFNSTLSIGSTFVMLRAAEIDFTGGSNSVTGTGSIMLESASSNGAVRIGGPSDSDAATLDLTDGDIAALANGFNLIRIKGFGPPSTTVVDASGATFLDALQLQAGGDVSLAGSLETSDGAIDVSSLSGEIRQLAGAAITTHDGAVTLSGAEGVTLDGVITTEGGAVSISTQGQNATIRTGRVGDSIVTSAAANSGRASGPVTLVAQGGVSLVGNIVTRGANNATGFGSSGSSGGAVSVTTHQGSVAAAGIDTRGGNAANIGGAGGSITIGSFAATNMAVNGDLLAGAGSGAATRAGGTINVNVAGHALVAGEARTSDASIQVISTGLDTQGTVATSGTGKVTLDGRSGAVTLVTAVSAGDGGIEIDGAAVTFHVLTSAGAVDIATNNGSHGLVKGDAGSTITTMSGGSVMSPGGSVRIVGDGGVELNGDIVTQGSGNGPSSFSSGGPVSISARTGSIRLAGIDTRGGSSTTSFGGGSITITGSGDPGAKTIISGALLAGGGTIDIAGEPLEAHAAIATSGSGKVTLQGLYVTLDGSVTAGSGGINISGGGIQFLGALATSGGNLRIDAYTITGGTGATITTESGSVTIVGNYSTSLQADIVTAGGTGNAGQGLPGGQVNISSPLGAPISLAGVDSRGGAATAPGSAGGTGGAIVISAAAGSYPWAIAVNGNLLASGGAEAGTSGRASGGAISVTSGFPADTTLRGTVETTDSTVDLRAGYLRAESAITTSGANGGVIVRCLFGMTLGKGLTAGRRGIDIAGINPFTGLAVALSGALVTSSGDVDIQTGLLSGSLVDTPGPGFANGTSITTTAAPNSGQRSGHVTITTGALFLTYSSINTSGADNAAGPGSAAGDVRLSASSGPILLRKIDARGGASTAPAFDRGDGGSIALFASNDLHLFNPVTTSGSGAIVLRSSSQQVTLEGDVGAGSGGVEIHGQQGVAFRAGLKTDGGNVQIDTGPFGAVDGATVANVGGPVVTTALAYSGRRSGDVTISGGMGVTLPGGVTTTGAGNNGSTVSAGGNVHISAPRGAIGVGGIDTRDGLAAGATRTFGGGTIALEAGGTNSTLGVRGMLDSGTGAMSLLAQAGVSFSATGGIQVDVGGLAAGSYTKITASKTFLFGGVGVGPQPIGTVRATFFNNFALTPGDRVPFYQTPQGNIVGSFDTEELPQRSGLSYSSNLIELVWHDQPPKITSDGGGPTDDINIPENQSVVTTVAATDPELDPVSFSLSGDDAQLLDIPQGGRTLQFRAPPDFEAPQDINQDNTYDVTLVATDAFGETDEQELAITVTPVNEAPMLTVITPVTIQQNTTTDVEILTATDPDRPPQTPTFSLGGTDGAAFRLVPMPDPQERKLQFLNPPDTAAPTDVDHDNVYHLTVTADDPDGATDTEAVQVTVRATPVQTVGLNNPAPVPEGDSGATQMTFTVALSLIPTQPVTVDYQTVDGTAGAGSDHDYVARSGTLTFAPNGPRIQTVAIDVIGDIAIEDDETFQVLLSNPVNAALGAPLAGSSPRGTGTIMNDDQPIVGLVSASGNHAQLNKLVPPIQSVTYGGLEGNSGTRTLTFPVFLTQRALTPVDVNYQVVSNPMGLLGPATAGVDYVAPNQPLTFTPGEISKNIDVQIIGDTIPEPHEAFKVVLTSAVGAAIVPPGLGLPGFQPEAIGIILDDDSLQAVDDAYTVTQGQALNIPTPGLLGNDIERDPSALPLIVTHAVTQPASGSLDLLPGDGRFVYTPDPQFTGTDSFVYELEDDVVRSSQATATITVVPDEDLDDVSDDVEAAAPNGGDGNADGIPDNTQASVTSLPAAIGGQYVTLVASRGATLAHVTTTPTLPPNPPTGSSFPLGLFAFEVHGVTPGGSAQVTLMLPPGVSVFSYYKFGPEAGNSTPHWYAFNYNGTTGTQISGSTLTLNFVDGQRGDADLAANGVIVDPGGPSCRRARC